MRLAGFEPATRGLEDTGLSSFQRLCVICAPERAPVKSRSPFLGWAELRINDGFGFGEAEGAC
jgi:hypothetical protein